MNPSFDRAHEQMCTLLTRHFLGLCEWKLKLICHQFQWQHLRRAPTNPISGFPKSLDIPPFPHHSQDVMNNTAWLSCSQMWRKTRDKGFIDGHKGVILLLHLHPTCVDVDFVCIKCKMIKRFKSHSWLAEKEETFLDYDPRLCQDSLCHHSPPCYYSNSVPSHNRMTSAPPCGTWQIGHYGSYFLLDIYSTWISQLKRARTCLEHICMIWICNKLIRFFFSLGQTCKYQEWWHHRWQPKTDPGIDLDHNTALSGQSHHRMVGSFM